MSGMDLKALLDQFGQALTDCKELYLSSAQLIVDEHPAQLKGPPDKFIQLMDDLHSALLIKIYISVAEADRRWSGAEQELAAVLFQHIWQKALHGDSLQQAFEEIRSQAAALKWYSLIRPFDKVVPLRERIAELETVVMRVANIVARSDGEPDPRELEMLQAIQSEFFVNLHPLQADEHVAHETSDAVGSQAVQVAQEESQKLHDEFELQDLSSPAASKSSEGRPQEERLQQSLELLEALIGLDSVKQEVRTLINFLKLQKQREQAGLPQTNIGLHMVFKGNPGTGKTTVARIVGEIYGAMGILKKGHLIETDRSGLVAEFAGQTGPKTNKKIDEALDGVLFVDEAYSLVAEKGDDPFGLEAIQTLLKRMEDDRERLVVILAGYPEQIDGLLKSNPGLSSRFTHDLTFEDYTPGQLGHIFGLMCDKNHYVLRAESQAKLLLGFKWLYDHRDEHFGNGRMVRNAFERAIRQLANRVAKVTELTNDLLTTFNAEDFDIEDVPAEFWEAADNTGAEFVVHCPDCGNSSVIPAAYLGKRVVCKKCQHKFRTEWGEPRLQS